MEMEDRWRWKIKKPKEIMYHQEQVHAPRLYEHQRNQLAWTNPIGHRHQELSWTNPLCHEMPFSDGLRISNSVQYQQNKDLSGPRLERKSALNAKMEMLAMNQALLEKEFEEDCRKFEAETVLLEKKTYLENLEIKRYKLERERQTAQLQAALQMSRHIRQTEALKKKHYESRMYEADMDHIGSQANRGDKRSYVDIWQTSGHIRPQMAQRSLEVKRPQADKENVKKEVRVKVEPEGTEVSEPCRSQLQKRWLEESRQKLTAVSSQASPQKWLKATMRGIQDLHETCFEGSAQNVQKDHPKEHEQTRLEVQELPREHLKKVCLEASVENLKSCSEESKLNVQEELQAIKSRLSKKSTEASKQNLQEWLEACIKNLQEECPEESRKDTKEGLEISKSYLQEKGPETSKLNVQGLKASMSSIQGLKETGFEGSAQNVQENLPEEPEEISLEVPQLPRDHLKKGWLEASLENLKRGGSEQSKSNVQKWLKASVTRLRGAPEAVKQSLKGWLEASIKTLPEEYPESSRKHVKEWLDVSISYLQKKGPETSKLNVEEWLHASMSGIQELRRPEFSKQNLQVGEHEASTIGVRPSLERTNLLEQSVGKANRNGSAASEQNVGKGLQLSSNIDSCEGAPRSMQDWLSESGTNNETEQLETPRQPTAERLISSKRDFQAEGPGSSTLCVRGGLPAFVPKVRKGASRGRVQEWLEASLRSLEAAGTEASKLSLQQWLEQNVGQQLQGSSDVNSCEVAPRSMLDWLSESGTNDEHLETPSRPTAETLVSSIGDFQAEGPRSSTLCVRGGLPAFVPKVRNGASRLRVQEWLDASLRSLEAAGAEASKLSLQQWVENSMGTLDESCPTNSRHDVEEWLQASLRTLEEPDASKQSALEWIGASLMSLKAECSEVPLGDVVEYLQGSIKDLQEEASRLSLQEWLEASLRTLQEQDPKSSRDDVKEWLESSLRKFRTLSPETSGHYVKKWLERSLRNLHTPKQNLQGYIKKSLMRLRAGNLAACTSGHSMDWLKVPQRAVGGRDSRVILKCGSSRAMAHLDGHGISRTSLISEGNEADLEEEEAAEISQIFISPEVQPKLLKQRGAKGKWSHKQGGSNTKMLTAKVSNASFRDRKPFLLLLVLIPIVLIALAFGLYRRRFSSYGGLRPI